MSLTKSMKSHQRIHKERSQPESRGNFGFLEKKKDYRLRAKDYQQKRNKLKVLRKKALNKNPDEFYFHMINSEMKDSFHYEKEKPEEYTEAQLKLMQTQDIRYVNYKHSIEAKKIEKLKSGLHLLDVEHRPKNNHTFFVTSKVEAKTFDVSSHLQTHSSLLDRAYNRPRLEILKRFNMHGAWSDEYIEDVTKERRKQYQELGKRIEREHELSILSQKLDIKKKLLNKKDVPIKVKEGTKVSAPVYLWKKERKR